MKFMIVLSVVAAVAMAQYGAPPAQYGAQPAQYGEQVAGEDGHNGAWRGEGIPESQDNGQWNQPAAAPWGAAPNSWGGPAQNQYAQAPANPQAWANAPGNNNPLWNVHSRPAGV